MWEGGGEGELGSRGAGIALLIGRIRHPPTLHAGRVLPHEPRATGTGTGYWLLATGYWVLGTGYWLGGRQPSPPSPVTVR
jgi:hypothetical protein